MITLDKGEVLKKISRRSIFFFLLEALFISIVAFIPYPLYRESSLPLYLMLFFYSVWLLTCWVFLFLAWLEYYLNSIIITDSRLIIISHKGLVSHKMEGVRLETMKDIILEPKGAVRINLTDDNGTVHIPKTAFTIDLKTALMEARKEVLERISHSFVIDETEQGAN